MTLGGTRPGAVAVRLAGVRKRFADVVAVDGVDLDVYRGGVGLVGTTTSSRDGGEGDDGSSQRTSEAVLAEDSAGPGEESAGPG